MTLHCLHPRTESRQPSAAQHPRLLSQIPRGTEGDVRERDLSIQATVRWKSRRLMEGCSGFGCQGTPNSADFHCVVKAELERFRKLFEFIEVRCFWRGSSPSLQPKCSCGREYSRKTRQKPCASSTGAKQVQMHHSLWTSMAEPTNSRCLQARKSCRR